MSRCWQMTLTKLSHSKAITLKLTTEITLILKNKKLKRIQKKTESILVDELKEKAWQGNIWQSTCHLQQTIWLSKPDDLDLGLQFMIKPIWMLSKWRRLQTAAKSYYTPCLLSRKLFSSKFFFSIFMTFVLYIWLYFNAKHYCVRA